MRSKHRKTLTRVFTKPAPTDVPWSDIEAMLLDAGVEVRRRSGAFVALVKDLEVMLVTPPHDKPLAIAATVKDIAAYLKAVGVEP